jgi:alkaline phosphatase D
MPGHSAMRAVRIWLQARGAGEVVVDYWPDGQVGPIASSEPRSLSAAQQFAAHIDIGGLEPGTTYAYRVRIDGEPVAVDQKLVFQTQPLWQWQHDPPPFRVVAGSCAYVNDAAYDRPRRSYGDRYDIFERIAAQSPDMMLWLGDNVYLREADYDSRWGMAERYRHTRALPELQSLLRSAHHYAVWDDHDYGPDNANHSFPLKGESLDLFRRYWANPAYGLPEVPGTFTRVTFRDVDFFLLDDRYYRNSDAAPAFPGKTMLGERQLAWLKDALLNSNAPFKIIANGSQMLNPLTEREGWIHFSQERRVFLAWLNETQVPGVLFLSGDAHYSALFRLEGESAAYPLYELTCSPLTAGPRSKGLDEGHPLLVAGTFFGQRNFCQLDFSGPREARRLKITVLDADGAARWTREILSGDLTPH